ncbi:hypothetical protein [Burkholderia arboris]|uniref:hypothetical protein n=1 Tax=Burkholderia arboris TaxID=488730 RepID=UPI001CF37B1D|nr:hypothetical protein [Burkholderia arboris]MCA8492584.1 hypothetical protein [Burkholderia arboris]
MAKVKTNRGRLRCKPGDLARIKYAWNQSLVGRIVVIGDRHSATEWNVTLIGVAGVTLTKDRRLMTATSRLLAYDEALEPLGLLDGVEEEVTVEGVPDARPLPRPDFSESS